MTFHLPHLYGNVSHIVLKVKSILYQGHSYKFQNLAYSLFLARKSDFIWIFISQFPCLLHSYTQNLNKQIFSNAYIQGHFFKSTCILYRPNFTLFPHTQKKQQNQPWPYFCAFDQIIEKDFLRDNEFARP